jgi:ribosome-binding protein aMBF1 (putative translation factor)
MRYGNDLLPKCSYVAEKGVCGKPCFRGICAAHAGRTSLTLCTRCGKFGTRSKTGICNSIETGCRWRAQYSSRKTKKARDDMDAYIDDLIESFNASRIDVPSIPCPPAQPDSGAPLVG